MLPARAAAPLESGSRFFYGALSAMEPAQREVVRGFLFRP
jgi:hypothetical protein